MGEKRIIYLTANELSVVHCTKGEFEELATYEASPSGLELFGQYLQRMPDLPTAIIVDVIEEEFRIETVPRVMGPDRSKLLNRKMEALFRETPFRSAKAIKGDSKDKKRENVLFSAVTKPEVLEPWLVELSKHKVPLVGIYSLPMVTQKLLKRLDIKHDNTLVLSIQQGRLLRQSFYSEGNLKISRLSPLSSTDVESCMTAILREIDKNQRYLGRLQLLKFGQPVNVVLISEGGLLERLKTGCVDTPQFQHHFVELNDTAEKIGLNKKVNVDKAEWLFAYFLSKHLPSSNYAPAQERAYYSMYVLRKWMVAASVLMAMAVSFWSMGNIYEGKEYKRKAALVEVDIQRANIDYQEAAAELPTLQYQPRVMRAAVESNLSLLKNKPKSLDALTMIGAVLSGHANIRLDEVQWGVDAEGVVAEGDTEFEAAVTQEVARVKAHLRKFPSNYQAAFKQIEEFMGALEKQNRIAKVQAVVLPLEINPENSLAGESQRFGDSPEASFEIRLWLKGDEHDV